MKLRHWFLLGIASFRIVVVICTSLPYHECAEDDLTYPQQISNYQEHIYTRRGFDEMQSMMPPFANLSTIYAAVPVGRTFRVLENGCGSGRSLLEAQAAYPQIHLFGTNFEGYGVGDGMWGQVDDKAATLISVAKHFKTPITCSDLDNRVILPTVVLIKSITEEHFEYPFPQKFFDLIISRDALNAMKVSEKESHVYIIPMLKVLKQGGIASLHLEYGANYMYPSLEGEKFMVVGIYKFKFEGANVSLAIYKGETDTTDPENFYKSYFGMIFKKCLPDSSTTPSDSNDCVVPEKYRVMAGDNLQLLKTPMSEDRYRGRVEATDTRVDFAFDYWDHLLKVLDAWERGGEITDPPAGV